VSVNTDGLVGDRVVDTTRHGDKDQAVYLYSAEGYAWWSAQLNQAVPMDMFRENLTLSKY
jgi:MOSC domain-containing protein YiiM